MEQIYNEKMSLVGYDQFVCDIFINWEDVKDEILLPDRKKGSGNGTVHVFLGAADSELRKEFANYYNAVSEGEDTSKGAVSITHYFMKSNVLSMLGFLCQYKQSKSEDFSDTVTKVLLGIEDIDTENALLATKSLFKLSTGSNKLRPYFKQFDEKGAFYKVIRLLLLPNSAYKIALYKNSRNEYAAFWLIGFDDLDDFSANSSSENIRRNEIHISLKNALQQIFYGAPGTGKSHTIKEQTRGEDVVRTTFHPDSDYSTFVGAYKPTTKTVPVTTVIGTKAVPVEGADGKPMTEDKIVYEFVSQAFLQAYIEAWQKFNQLGAGEEAKKEYLIIEEINRGNCAQIFGDLFQLLDRGAHGFSEYPIKADADMQKQLHKAFAGVTIPQEDEINKHFDEEDIVSQVLNGEVLLLPSNLYIWATMNTSDQSLFPIDSAFKRRWDWNYVPISDAGERWAIDVNGAKYDWWQFLVAINSRIYDATYSEDKKLGYFFCKAENGVISAEKFVSKVVFYLWNDVFKDSEFEGEAFSDGDNGKLSFDKFYITEAGKTEVNEKKVERFLNNLELKPVSENDDDEEYKGQKESTDDGEQSEWTETEKKRYEYWDTFLKYAPEHSQDFATYFGGIKKSTKSHWKNFFVTGTDFYLVAIQQRRRHAIEMQVYYDQTTDEYYRLFAHKDEIEKEMGVKYEWNEIPDKKSSIISEEKHDVDFENKEDWPVQFDFIIDRLLRMRAVFLKYAKK